MKKIVVYEDKITLFGITIYHHIRTVEYPDDEKKEDLNDVKG